MIGAWSPAPCPCYAPRFTVLLTDGCYTPRVLLRQNQCVRATTSVPLAQKTRPRLASWAAHFRLPASGLSPGSCGDGWVGAWRPTSSLVLPSVLGVPLPQCLLEVPSRTPVSAPISHLLGSKRLPCPSMAKTLGPPSATPFSTPEIALGRSVSLVVPLGGTTIPARKEGVPAGTVEPAVSSEVSLTSSRPVPVLYPRPGGERSPQQAPPGLSGFTTARCQHRDIPVTASPSREACTAPQSG